MKAILISLVLIVLTGTCFAKEKTDDQPPSGSESLPALPFASWEFQKTDGQLWLHFHSSAAKDREKPRFHAPPIYVQLAGVKTKFVPLVYVKGNEQEKDKQREINDAIAKFIAEQLKGKTVWIEDAAPAVFAGPRQILGIVWFDKERKRSLQQMLVKKGLAEKHPKRGEKR